jgi:hypothetical protein
MKMTSAVDGMSKRALELCDGVNDATLLRASWIEKRMVEIKQVGGLHKMAEKLDYPSFADYINNIQVQAEMIANNMRAIQEEL